MSASTVLSRIPILRVLVPLALGILLHRVWHVWWAPLTFLALAVIGYVILYTRSRSPQEVKRWRPYFIIPLTVASLSLGWLSAVIHCPPRLTDDQLSGRMLAGRVVDLNFTDFSMRMTVEVANSVLPPCRVLLSTRGCDYTMQAGELVAWQASLHEVGHMGNPDEMDYASYLIDSKGIRYQQHMPLKEVHRVGQSPTLVTRMATVRRDLQLAVFNSRLSPPAQQFVVALLLGNSSMIDKATRAEFSSAGIAHVLALSGLHVGLLALIIWWMLFPLDYMRMKKVRLVITLIAIAAFALFTGLSPSVVRATVMIGFTFAAWVFYRRSSSLNALAMAALIILVFTPSALYSVGFQLSFITVGAVLLFSRLPERLQSRHRWVNNITATALTSMVAMLATVALSTHYFHTVSLMSVLSNLLVLPVLPVFMALGALFLLVTAAGLHWQVLDWALDVIYRYIHWTAGFVNGLPLSHVNGVYVSTMGVILYFVMMALVAFWLYRRNYRYLLAAGCVLVVMLAHSLWVDAKTPRRGMVIFNSFSSTPLLYYDSGKGYVWTPDEEEPDSAAFSRYHAGFLARHNIDELRFITAGDTLRLEGALIRPPFAHLMGRRMLAVGSGKWKQASTDHRLDLDDIIITKRFHGTAAKLGELYRFERLVLSGAMHEPGALLHQCDSLHITVHDLSTQGAITVP